MPTSNSAELIGSNDALVRLTGGTMHTQVRLTPASGHKSVAAALEAVSSAKEGKPGDRVFLKLENLRGKHDAAMFYVYVGLSDDETPEQHPENFAGTVSFFGASKASRQEGGQSGNGLSQVIDITKTVEALRTAGKLGNLTQLDVRFVPRTAVNDESETSVGKVTVYQLPG